MKHLSYKQRFGRDMDFLVRYSRLPGSNLLIPRFRQGMRFDFTYQDSPVGKNYMIWPEFVFDDGKTIDDDVFIIPDSGVAGMWVVNSEMMDFHKRKLKENNKGYFVIGNERIANTELIKLGSSMLK
jgi:hypothetical protein